MSLYNKVKHFIDSVKHLVAHAYVAFIQMLSTMHEF